MTEYLLTADIAREFTERDYPVTVECHNRMFVNAITGLKAAQPRKLLRSKRTDVAVIDAGLIPLALIEVKIRVKKHRAIKGDLDKITNTMSLLKANFVRESSAQIGSGWSTSDFTARTGDIGNETVTYVSSRSFLDRSFIAKKFLRAVKYRPTRLVSIASIMTPSLSDDASSHLLDCLRRSGNFQHPEYIFWRGWSEHRRSL
jgi:hypothetical protein